MNSLKYQSRKFSRVWWIMALLPTVLLLISYSSQSQISDTLAPVDPLLQLIMQLDEKTLNETGQPFNLTHFADIIGVRVANRPVLQGPREAGLAVLQQTVADRVEVIITLVNVDDLIVQQIRDLGISVGSIAGNLITAWVTPGQLRNLRMISNVIHISASYRVNKLDKEARVNIRSNRVKPEDEISVPDTNASSLQAAGIRGQNVIVGVIDTGIDFCHRDFRSGDSTQMKTRIISIWDQNTDNGPSNPPSGFNYGQEWAQSQIEAALTSCPNVTAIPEKDEIGHGTHVASTSAGNGSALTGNTYIGMAPEANIIAVKCFPDCTDAKIIDGANYIFNKANNLGKAAVINLSLGSQFGPHDGTSDLDRGLDALLGSETSPNRGRAIVAAAGNSGDSHTHVQTDLNAGNTVDFTFSQPSGNGYQVYGSDLFDFWYPGAAQFCATVISPNGSTVGPVCAGQQKYWKQDADANTPDGGLLITNETPSPFNGDRQVVVLVFGTSEGAKAAAPGIWTIRFNAMQGSGRLDGWATSGANEFDPTFVSADTTVGSPGSAKRVITAGAYSTRTTWTDKCGRTVSVVGETLQALATFSSRGPTRDGRIKPDIAAPGTMIAAALSKDVSGIGCKDPLGALVLTPDNTYWVLQGTSMASPHVTGGVALLFQQNPNLSWNEIKEILQSNAHTDSNTDSTPNNEWGAGKLRLVMLGAPSPSTADLSITGSTNPKIGSVGSNLTYTFSITNNGPDAATNVTFTDVLPAGLNFVSAVTGQGNCTGTNSVTCNLNNLAIGANATVTLVAVPTVSGNISNTANVIATETDPNSTNNAAMLNTNVNGPCQGVTASSSPPSVTYTPARRRAARQVITVTIINNSGTPMTVTQISAKPGQPFTIVGISPALGKTIPNGKKQKFSVKTQRAAGLPAASAVAPYFNIVLTCGTLTTASILLPLEMFNLQGIAVQLQRDELHLQASGTGIRSVQLQLFDLNGHSIMDKTGDGSALSLMVPRVRGKPLSNGLYLYVVSVRGLKGEMIREVRKLIVLR
ncbi:S8 family serine peptidase [Candidatus Acetothermia bacterium]|nr:S8 family serine peptidase [Candidatus Acetothermia bacterium]